MSDLSNSMLDLFSSAQRREAGFRTRRGLAWVLLASWLFTLAVCFYSDIYQPSMDIVDDATAAHEHNGLGHSDDSAHETDVCCTILQNLPLFYKMGNIEVPLQHLMYTLLPYVFVVQTALRECQKFCV